MRIWDIDPGELCRHHLLGEHRELHGLWNILTQKKEGYSRHPETRRWVGKLTALYARHEALVREMERRGYAHRSPPERRPATGGGGQKKYLGSPGQQRRDPQVKTCPRPRRRPWGGKEGSGGGGN